MEEERSLESMVEIKKFTKKTEILDYVKSKFSKENDLILIRGSTATKRIKKFSDVDIEIYGSKLKKPYYELILLNNNPSLLSAYYYKYEKGKEIIKPNGVNIIYGEYNNKIKPNFDKDTYNNKEKIIRECQLLTDFFFKYLRTKDNKYLKSVQKRIKS